jgi:hypothetical protein
LEKTITVKVFRFEPGVDRQPYYKSYEVPLAENMSAMNALDYIYQNLDSTLAYYDHAGCSLGICKRCGGRINGKPALLCQTPLEGDTTIEPVSKDSVLKDLVANKAARTIRVETGCQKEDQVVDVNDVPMILRREIEAKIAAPLIKAFMEEFGGERTLETARTVIGALAEMEGQKERELVGGNSLEDFQKTLPMFSKGGALEVEMVEASPSRVIFKVTKCRYAEMYRRNGIGEFGYMLSCARDFASIEGFNPALKLTRTQTIMEGGDFCDFCFSPKKE